ncbi:response regulator [uncultured Sphingomonas sp.]|uniref:response regulator n=1 Tax=uncultured Sphingomonas sp. TaxID=158754 RepID=UPI0025D8C0C3|nr:response regulator [uncultured Sphingomonas sp.]
MSLLHNKRVLLVEDEAVIAFAVEDALLELGCEVVGPAFCLEEAVALASAEPIDAAILDVNLNEQRSYAVADELKRRGVPFLFATGYAEGGLDWDRSEVDVLSKPYRKDQIAAALCRLLRF